jgi:hypothetical protein
MSKVKISDKFQAFVAKSKDTKDYEEGEVPFVTSAESNNGMVRCVEPLENDRVFEGPCVVISGLGFATFQVSEFLPKGNGGDSCTILYAKEKFSVADYIGFAAAFNALHKWRFSYWRKCGINRIMQLEIPWPLPEIKDAWKEEAEEIQIALKIFGGSFDEKKEAELPNFDAPEEKDASEPVESTKIN